MMLAERVLFEKGFEGLPGLGKGKASCRVWVMLV